MTVVIIVSRSPKISKKCLDLFVLESLDLHLNSGD
jgi:hypothetical protein